MKVFFYQGVSYTTVPFLLINNHSVTEVNTIVNRWKAYVYICTIMLKQYRFQRLEICLQEVETRKHEIYLFL